MGLGPPSKSPHSKFLGVGSSSNSLSMSAPSPNIANRSVNPSLPDVTKDTSATDEFRKYSCKIEKCPYHDDSPHIWRQSSSLSAYSRYAAGTAMGFEPAPCPVPDSPSISVSLPMRPSTIEISNNAPNYPFESSNEQTILSRPSLSADSPRPQTSFSSNTEDGFPGIKYHTCYGPFSPKLTSTDDTDRSRKQKQSMLSRSTTLDDEIWYWPTPDLSWVDALLDEPED